MQKSSSSQSHLTLRTSVTLPLITGIFFTKSPNCLLFDIFATFFFSPILENLAQFFYTFTTFFPPSTPLFSSVLLRQYFARSLSFYPCCFRLKFSNTHHEEAVLQLFPPLSVIPCIYHLRVSVNSSSISHVLTF